MVLSRVAEPYHFDAAPTLFLLLIYSTKKKSRIDMYILMRLDPIDPIFCLKLDSEFAEVQYCLNLWSCFSEPTGRGSLRRGGPFQPTLHRTGRALG
jgi:hypothetical protein